MSTTVKNSKMARRYGEEFKRQVVELLLHSGKTQRQVARELDVSDYPYVDLVVLLCDPMMIRGFIIIALLAPFHATKEDQKWLRQKTF
jgi:transposase